MAAKPWNDQPPLDPAVLIVGAGPTGLVLALQLARRGTPVRIIDRNSGPGQASRAIAVHARTLEFYAQLGIAEAVVARGIRVGRVRLRARRTSVVNLNLGDLGKGLSPFPFVLSFPQDDHERFLVDQLAAAGVAVEWGVELTSFTQDATGVRAELDRSGAAEICEAAYLCGCDGLHSRVRQGLGIGFPGGAYDQLFYVADVVVEGAAPADLTAALDSGGFALQVPVRNADTQRLIGIAPPSGGAHPSFDDIRPSAERLLGVRLGAANWFSTYHVHHRVAANFRVGRCFLAGDAGHVHSPAGGQGMNTGIGDAVNLAWKLAAVLRRRAGPSLLDTYEPERIVFARKLVATTDRAFQSVVAPGAGGRLLRGWLAPTLALLLTRFSIVRRMMFRTVSQIGIGYLHGALSVGQAGKVRGGDRLPWVAHDEADNFAPLRSLDWQVHIYGEGRGDFVAAAGALHLPVHLFDWSDLAAKAGLKRDAAYVVRPDGHVALASAGQVAEDLRRFSTGLGLNVGPRPTP